MAVKTHKKNDELAFLVKDHRSVGNLMINGRFVDPYKKMDMGFKKFLKWQSSRNIYKEEKENEGFIGPWSDATEFLISKKDGMVWLGHATFLLRLNEVLFITDPMLFKLPIMKRYTKLPLDPKELLHIQYVLLSHAHRDHCDQKSLTFLHRSNKFHLLTSLNTSSVVKGFISGLKSTEFGWYQTLNINDGIKITFLPTQHWSNRFPWDNNKTLWGSFMLETESKTIYFGGDSGFTKHHEDIAALFPNIDISILGIGAYEPDFIMSYSHMNPEEAFATHKILKSKHLFPMHYACFDLSDEPLGQPLKRIKAAFDAEGRNSELLDYEPGKILYF